MAEDVFKNLQVIKGIPVNQFMETMGFFTASVGGDCTFCHVSESNGSWAKYAGVGELVIPAAVGDFVEIDLACVLVAASSSIWDVGIMVGGSISSARNASMPAES